ncbi:MAG: DUF4160 domain-containing protein [Fusobacteriaceae bacterium]|jgi:hypothetical protein|nr:DUF4160 domain-containing protein [Fusobacteriaceae bacterium]
MPTLSVFFGIIITMYREIGGKHNLPHFHAQYQDFEAAVSFDGEVLEGALPPNKLKLVLAWTEIHKEDLKANWILLEKGIQTFRIEPLR